MNEASHFGAFALFGNVGFFLFSFSNGSRDLRQLLRTQPVLMLYYLFNTRPYSLLFLGRWRSGTHSDSDPIGIDRIFLPFVYGKFR
jgi:hypothetical protein